ncbi:MAG: AmmeMemoRadiSam system protein A [Candidatus Aenigmatarchaeota archaeon]
MNEKLKSYIIKIAKKAIENYVKYKKIISVPADCPEELKQKRGVFVTIYKNHELRGCTGVPFPIKSLIESLIEAAVNATEDPRFLPLTENELKNIKIEVSILTEPKKVEGKDYKEKIENIKEFKHGVIIKRGLKSALFLPQIWNQLHNKDLFLSHLCLKAGLSADDWKKDDTEFYIFEAEVVEES